ncbi:P-loop containing nucleoside triphosphate hydrolase protein [Haematococcus lacustris]
MAQNTLVYDRWFAFADTDRDGRVTGKDAVSFFEKSGLPRDVLAKVWDMANSGRQGYLDRMSFHKAMDLISLAQQGHEVTKEHYQTLLDSQAITIPTLAGFNAEGLPEAPMLMQQYPATTSFGGAGPSFMSPTVYSPETTPRWGKKGEQKRPVPAKVCTSIVDGLKQVYNSKVKPLEEAFKFGNFFSPLLNDSDFEAKPSVLLLGQYSTGKTTFIKYLLGRDYPGSHIGPEPTTDRFVVVYHGLEERRVPGNTLAVQPDKPYQGLASFGTGFLSRFEGSQCPARLLEEITLVDTPGVLSGEKQRIERSYNFVEIARWFAARCDLIFLLFDPYKLDISDEFKQVITAMRGHDDKVRVILNKADQVDQQQLMRVYGALMWSLGKVFRSPEVCRVYVGSFNSDAPISEAKNPYGRTLFEAEQKELLASLYDIPQRSCDRKINEFVKRVRACKMHLLLVGHLRKQMPSMFGKEAAQKKLLQDLPAQFTQVMREHHLPQGDFPDPARFGEIMGAFDLLAFPKLTKEMLKQIDNVLSVDIPNLVKQFDNPFP